MHAMKVRADVIRPSSQCHAKISANRDMYPGLYSMRQILKQYERGSGLVMALNETINSPQ